MEHAPIDPGLQYFLDEERVARGGPQNRILDARRQAAGESVEHPLGFVWRQRLEPDPRGVRVPLIPWLRPPDQLRPRGTEQQQQRSARLSCRDGQKLEQRILGPVEVLDNDADRAVLRDLIEERDPGLRQPRLRLPRLLLCLRCEPQKRAEVNPSPRRPAMTSGGASASRSKHARTISPSGRVFNRPYDRHRPSSQRPGAGAIRSWRAPTRLVFPMPASPTSVTK